MSYFGSKQTMLIGLKGDKGDQGIQGAQGIQGEQGIQGAQGNPGVAGLQGRSIFTTTSTLNTAGGTVALSAINIPFGMGLLYKDLIIDESGNIGITGVASGGNVPYTFYANIGGGGGTVDTTMSSTSENAVQNKVIKAYVDNSIATAITTALNDEV